MRWRPADILSSSIALALALCATASARPTPVFDTAGVAPVSSDLVIVVERARELRDSRCGRLIAELVNHRSAAADAPGDALPSCADTTGAWRALAARLGWTPQDCFDELLGTRAMLVSRQPAGKAGGGRVGRRQLGVARGGPARA